MLRGKKVKLNVSKAETPVLNMSIHNKFDIEVLDASTGAIKQKTSGYNIICDNLWKQLCGWKQYADYIHFGSGTGITSSSDTSLFNFVGYKSVNSSNITRNIDYNKGLYTIQRKIEISETEHNEIELTEVGLAYGYDSNTLCTHAMLMDMNGNPISIKKTSNDIINIYSTVYVHFNPFGYDNGSITLYKASTSYNILDALGGSNACRDGSTSYDDTYGYVYNYGVFSVKYDSSSYRTPVKVTHSGDYTSKTLTLTMDRIPVASCNVGGVKYIDFDQHYQSYGTHYSARFGLCVRAGGTWFPYSDITNDAIGTGDGSTTKFNLSFQYARDVEVLVNGQKVTNFTAKYGVRDTANFIHYMDILREGSTVNNFIYNYSVSSSFTSVIFHNPMNEVGISAIRTSSGLITVYASNDLVSWTKINDPSSIETFYQKYKFWKIESTDSIYYHNLTITPAGEVDSCVIFNAPPSAGAVITATYKSDTIAKDENHVFDLSLTIHLGEYTEA